MAEVVYEHEPGRFWRCATCGSTCRERETHHCTGYQPDSPYMQLRAERDEARDRLRDLGARDPAAFIREGRCVVCGEGSPPGEPEDPDWHTMSCLIRRLLLAEGAPSRGARAGRQPNVRALRSALHAAWDRIEELSEELDLCSDQALLVGEMADEAERALD